MSLSDLVPPLEKPRRQATAIPLTQLFDRAKIAAQIAKAHAEGLAGDALRRLALELFRPDSIAAGSVHRRFCSPPAAASPAPPISPSSKTN